MECRKCPDRKDCQRQCMKIPAGKTCGDCQYVRWCAKVYGVKPENRSCHFEPVRFKQKEER